MDHSFRGGWSCRNVLTILSHKLALIENRNLVQSLEPSSSHLAEVIEGSPCQYMVYQFRDPLTVIMSDWTSKRRSDVWSSNAVLKHCMCIFPKAVFLQKNLPRRRRALPISTRPHDCVSKDDLTTPSSQRYNLNQTHSHSPRGIPILSPRSCCQTTPLFGC
jgi:hypothetical protein